MGIPITEDVISITAHAAPSPARWMHGLQGPLAGRLGKQPNDASNPQALNKVVFDHAKGVCRGESIANLLTA